MQYKEFLNANDNYNLVMLPEHAGDDERSGLIEVPDGAESFNYLGSVENKFFLKTYADHLLYSREYEEDWRWYSSIDEKDERVCLWQRNAEKSENNCGEVGSVEKHSHYFKDFSDCKKVDVYRVLDRFNVVHPCQQHIAKKALCAGNRGHKDLLRDIQDIIDTAERWKEMLLEGSIID